MALGVRGANPIWAEFDLAGKIFDDTFYMYVLQNTLPYLPATVYHDPDLNQPWTDPIRFLGNGTLPVDVFFESDVVYRLEFRQNDGISMPSQADPLIYEVNNYVAGSGGSTPVDTVAFASSNQVTNPQFSLINFTSPLSVSGTNPAPIEIGPGWFLQLAGTGTVTITQVPLNNSNANPSNAPYALRLQLTGWTTDSVILRQRFQQNGMLWANKIVSSTLTARIEGAPQSVSATLVDSNSSTLAQVLPLTVINEAWNEFTGYGELPATTNPNTPPAAYIDYRLLLPSNADIYLSSIQLVVQELPFKPSFEQDSIERQIDHTYHYAYPIVPVGTIIDYAGFNIPEHYYLCDATAKSRIDDNLLFQALTTTETVSLTSGSPTFTVASSDNYHIGMAIEGIGIPAATTILNIVATTITMSANATSTTSSLLRFFAWGAGDGSTTFNLPSLADYVTAGANGSLFGAGNNAVGAKGGSDTTTLAGANLPVGAPYNPAAGTGNFVFTAVGAANVPGNNAGNAWQFGVATPFSTVQQTAFVKKCIRFE